MSTLIDAKRYPLLKNPHLGGKKANNRARDRVSLNTRMEKLEDW
jgi:hypothetical protein